MEKTKQTSLKQATTGLTDSRRDMAFLSDGGQIRRRTLQRMEEKRFNDFTGI